MDQSGEKKTTAKYRILSYMLDREQTSKAELAKQLDLSMPTVLSNVNALVEQGILTETGEQESTGGRRARLLGIREDYRFSMGINITANHVAMVLINLKGEIIRKDRYRERFVPDVSYCSRLAERVQAFLGQEGTAEKVLGIGVALPGIVHTGEKLLVKSHALALENYSLRMLEQLLPLPAYFENDANAAMLAENPGRLNNAVYLSLNNTLGGAICMNGALYTGENRKAGEFGHMLLVPGGKTCYCGKKGCADAYCAAAVLTRGGEDSLEEFMEDVRSGRDAGKAKMWQEYLEHLAILISNLRMAFDTDIILGGDAGGYLADDMVALGEKLFVYNLFDRDLSYLKTCVYKREAAAVGAAKYFFEQFVREI